MMGFGRTDVRKREIVNLAIVLVLLPAIYIGYSELPWAVQLFDYKDRGYFFPFWGGLIAIHWISVVLVYFALQAQGMTFSEIGLGLKMPQFGLFVAIYGVLFLIVFTLIEWSLQGIGLTEEQLRRLPGLVPTSTEQRLFFGLVAFSTGFCEELVFRGYAITKLKQAGLNQWVALILAGLAFVAMHGLNGIEGRFLFLFLGAIAFGLLFIATKRLMPGIVIHLLINLSAAAAPLQFIHQ